MNIYIKKEEE